MNSWFQSGDHSALSLVQSQYGMEIPGLTAANDLTHDPSLRPRLPLSPARADFLSSATAERVVRTDA
ncbi:hypothetical protein F558DRAFT_02775 [Streptomyces sp. AmelKG-A3]|nr:hypothetical protein GA0115247_102459 [Streptomyces sp. PalvLS-984]SDC88271.1 hypothetical protein F558DRAFT_02775 [Streptomyces sp. AmelKG-A3]